MSGAPIVVLGAGPAGLAAADAASAGGQAVVLLDENHAPGGQIWRGGPAQWRDPRASQLWQRVSARANVEVIGAARVVATAGPQTLLLEPGAGARTLAWSGAILCSGARELLLPFPGWTLPGVTGAGGMQALLKGGMPIAGKSVVVAGTGPLLLAVAESVQRYGGNVAAIVEYCSTASLARFGMRLALSHQAKFTQAALLFARLRRIPYLRGALVREALGTTSLHSVLIDHAGSQREIDCDFLACGFGLRPALESASLFGCATQNGSVLVDLHQRTSADAVWAAGEVTGIGGVDKALAEGRIAGLAAVGKRAAAADVAARTGSHRFAQLLASTFPAPPPMQKACLPSTIVCRCEDVRAEALVGRASWREAKLQTRLGMGPCQGRVCGAACEFLYGWDCGSARPPVFPARAGTLASIAEGAQAEKPPA